MSGVARARLAAVGLVLLGFSLGVLADHLWLAYRMHASAPELTHQESMIALLGSLGLTEEQDRAIKAVVHRYQTNVERHLEAVHPMIFATMDSARHEIENLLDPDQLAAFRGWLRAEHERLGTVRRSVIPH